MSFDTVCPEVAVIARRGAPKQSSVGAASIWIASLEITGFSPGQSSICVYLTNGVAQESTNISTKPEIGRKNLHFLHPNLAENP
jgi:hypothetical protein